MGRIAPIAALGLLLVSLAGRFAGWPLPVIGALMAIVVAAVAVVAWVKNRRRETADVTAARVDHDAALGGELRSAHWFATSPDHNEWTTFHLERAAARASSVSWSGLYPASPNHKAWAAAVVCAIIALVLPISWPKPIAAVSDPVAGGTEASPAVPGDEAALLRAKLEALLANMKDGKADMAATEADLETLKKLMAAVDPALQKKLDELLKKKPVGADAKTKNLDDEDLAERGNNADAAAGLPEDVKWALEDLAARLANANANRQTNESNPAATAESGEKGRGSAQAQMAEAKAGESSVQMMREAAGDPGAAKMMPGGGGMMGGDSRSGAGGNNENAKAGAATPEQIALALRKELIEANTDNLGENVNKEDIRRKTEQGKSTIGFARVTATTNFDSSRATAPPVVPEARRPLLQRYFIRR